MGKNYGKRCGKKTYVITKTEGGEKKRMCKKHYYKASAEGLRDDKTLLVWFTEDERKPCEERIE